mmetsp:Transcript_25941/g.88787  ORF Transcript_25941/g.88787 Transcript_25941/m.88787 type:complete len:236 (-) Transcript_25941:89-796(-)
MASSTSHGRLVAASTVTLAYSSVVKPSHMDMNSVFIVPLASCSELRLLERNESISSMKMRLGCSFHARVNTAVTSFCASPNHLLCRVASRTLRNAAWHSFASALASMVLPVPGGPYSSTPLGGRRRLPRWKSSGRCRGRITSSSSASFTSCRPPMCLKLTDMLAGLTTSHAMTSSYWFVLISGRPRRFAISALRALARFVVSLSFVGSSALTMILNTRPDSAALASQNSASPRGP